MKDTISNIGVSSGLMVGLSINNYICKVCDCTFFLSSTLSISLLLTLLNLGHLVRTRTKMTFMSAYIGLANALADIVVIFLYTRMLRYNSLFFCLMFLAYQMFVSITTCFMPLTDAVFLIIICVLFIYPIFELEFVERNGFTSNQAPKLIWGYVTSSDTNVLFVPVVGFKILLSEFSRRAEDGGASGVFNSVILFLMGSILALSDTPAFREELSKVGKVAVPFAVAQGVFALSVFVLKLNRRVSLSSMYPFVCVLFVTLSSVFCSELFPSLWQKTIIETTLNGPYLFLLLVFSVLVGYTMITYGSKISSRFSRESFISGVFTSL